MANIYLPSLLGETSAGSSKHYLTPAPLCRASGQQLLVRSVLPAQALLGQQHVSLWGESAPTDGANEFLLVMDERV